MYDITQNLHARLSIYKGKPTAEAIGRAEHWWQAAEVMRVFPDGKTVSDFFAWLTRYQLGRNRLLDTILAATCQRRNSNLHLTPRHKTRPSKVERYKLPPATASPSQAGGGTVRSSRIAPSWLDITFRRPSL